MPIKFECPCGKILAAPDDAAGKRACCPKCGAYWGCGCELADALSLEGSAGCAHDWNDVVAVEVEHEAYPGPARVVVCRLCGIYSVLSEA